MIVLKKFSASTELKVRTHRTPLSLLHSLRSFYSLTTPLASFASSLSFPSVPSLRLVIP
jgi:hypothetical protein